MTVSQIYKLMADKVIPESVMPQNIPALLMDDNEAIPELDAFTFLNRVRALGIGSADFLYLLEGCDAPAEAIEKIENNPAMNLQGLVVTLESSGLTAKDYTRMLYTARQLWERTLTMQLDEMTEDSRTDEEILGEVLGEQSQYDADYEDYESVEISDETEDEYEEPDDDSSDIEEEPSHAVIPPLGEYGQDTDEDEYDEPDDSSDIEEEPVNAVVPPIADYTEDVEFDEDDEIIDRSEKTVPAAARQKARNFNVDIQYDDPEDIDANDSGYDDENDRPELDFGIHDREERAKSNGGRIAASAVGAAVLLGLSAAANCMGFAPKEAVETPDVFFASDSQQIFTEILNNYNSGMLGGDGVIPRSFSDGEVFGNMLIQKPRDGSDRNALGTYTIGRSAFSAYSDEILLYREVSGTVVKLGAIPAPEKGEYIAMIPLDDKILAVFRDDDSAGFICYTEGGETVYSANQHGVLTDISVDDDSISFGTVYIPSYSQNIKTDDTELYLPVIGLDSGRVELNPTDIIISESQGCGYAVYAEYNLSDGTLADSGAVLGNPVYSDADRLCGVMKLSSTDDNGEKTASFCQIVTAEQTTNEEGVTVDTPCIAETSILLSADGNGSVIAAVQNDENGEPLVYIYTKNEDGGISAVSALNNLPEGFCTVHLEGDVLYLCSDREVLAAADISDPKNPSLMELYAKRGIIRDNLALTTEPSGTMVKLTLYKLTDGKSAEAGSYAKNITSSGNEAAISGSLNTFILESEECCGAAFSYFDGVSRISEYGLFGKVKTSQSMFDDRTGYTAAAVIDGKVIAISGDRTYVIN